jgi:hypothetical protein
MDVLSVSLPTSGGSTVEAESVVSPFFFSGFVQHPEVVAAALLVVARVARTSFYTPPGVIHRLRNSDPIVTSTPEGLRFESFSGCCGVYARLDVLAEALDASHAEVGVTNVDVNAELRAVLAGVVSHEPMHFVVGDDELRVSTLDAEVVEERVPLPDRWVKGLAESQVAASGMSLRHELDARTAVAFVSALPKTSPTTATMWAVASLRSLRLATRPAPGAVSVAGPERLAVLAPLLRFATGLRAYGPEASDASAPLPSAWQLDLPGARLTIGLSPEKSRGFSGEGALLESLASGTAAEDADTVRMLLAYEPRIEVAQLAVSAGLSESRTRDALAVLAASGQVGYDLAADAYFHRPLPFDARALGALNPRLVGAKKLVAAGNVCPQPDGTVLVGSTGLDYLVRLGAHDGDHCSCPWYGKHKGSRGPCKHVLAAQIAAQR